MYIDDLIESIKMAAISMAIGLGIASVLTVLIIAVALLFVR